MHLPLGGFGHTQKVESIARTPHQSGEAQSGATTSRCAFLRTGLAVGAGTVDACLGHDPQWIHVDVSRPGGGVQIRSCRLTSSCPSARLQRRASARVRDHSPDAGSDWGPSRRSMRSRPTGCSSGSRGRSVPLLEHTDDSGQGRACRPTRVHAGPGRGWSADSQGCLEEGASCSTPLPLLNQRPVAAR